MAKSTLSTAARKATVGKPRPDFPLTPHPTGRWCKKVKGKLHYFGRIEGDAKGEAALELWLDQKDDLLAGRKPCVTKGGLKVGDLCNKFLTSKLHRLQANEITPRTFADYKSTTDRIVRVFQKNRSVEDLGPDDFGKLRRDIAKTRNPESVGNEINRIRGVFKFGIDNHLTDKPIRYGSDFERPSKRILRKVRNEREEKFLEADEIRKMQEAAGPQLRAMILLGVNCGLGNSDVASLPIAAVNLDSGWVDFPRPKTGVQRRCPLWPETVAAIRAWLAVRPVPNDVEAYGHLLFITAKTRTTWGTDLREDFSNADVTDLDALAKKCHKSSENPLSKEVRKLLDKLDIKRQGVAFYSLRHVFETIGGESRDQVAVDFIMGHARDDMASRYRERISDERLRAVTDHVRTWLFSEQPSDADAIEADDDKTPPATTTEAK
jgi:integrase